MSIVSIFSGCLCKEDLVVQEVLSRTGYRLITDQDIVSAASHQSDISEDKISLVFSAKTSVFNKFTHEKECSIAYLKLVLYELLSEGNLVIAGFAGQLIPKEVHHILRVCLIADMKFRIAVAVREQDFSEKEALKYIRRHDEDRAVWVETLFKTKDPWDAAIYDIVIPVDKMTPAEAAILIAENAGKDVVKETENSKQAFEDFHLAAKAEVALTREGHNVEVSAKDGSITLTINKHVLMLSRLEDELKSIVEQVPGVTSVESRVGTAFHKTDIYRKYNFEMPSKVLLVDDEREFVHTLSERLMMRDIGPAVAYDGESALNLIKEDDPEVMILDLKMPGIDGLEVLKRVKETRPEIEVIILTGHGHEADRELCMKLGAFAYLQKPLDINELSEIIKKANEKIRQKKAPKR